MKMKTGMTFEKWSLYLINKDSLVISDLSNAFPCVLFLSNESCVVGNNDSIVISAFDTLDEHMLSLVHHS